MILRKNPNWLTVVGVARDAKQDELDRRAASGDVSALAAEQQLSAASHPATSNTSLWLCAPQANLQPSLPTIKAAVAALDKNVPVSEIETMDQAVADLNAQPRFELWLLGSFAGLAVLLAALGSTA